MIYIDVYAIWNLLIDTILLWLTGCVRRRKARWYRLLAGGVCGMLWALAVVLCPLLQGSLIRNIGSMLAAGGMCAAAYGVHNRKSFRLLWLTLFLLTWLAGGLIRFIYEQTGAGYYMQMLLYGTGEPPAAFFTACISLLAFTAFFFGFRLARQYTGRGRFQVEVVIQAGKQTVQTSGLIDTGNRLHTPSGQPVAVAARPVLLRLLGEEEIEKAEQYQGEAAAGCSWIYIPYRSIGKKAGLLPAVRITSITIQKEEGAVTVPDAWLALGPEILCSDGKRQIILPPEW